MREKIIKWCILLSRAIFGILFAITSGCVVNEHSQKKVSHNTVSLLDIVDKDLENIFEKHQINTAGIAIIKNGKIVGQGYFGQQSEQIPASAETLFNVASITKTVTTETVLKLVAQGKVLLDEPMAKYWIDPDLKNAKYLYSLTPRMALTHTTGFPNWRFFEKDGKLKFKQKPGTTFGYSGEGMKYLARFVENKLSQPFEQIVKSTILKPLNMDSASISVRKQNFSRIAKPLDEKNQFYGYYCYSGGYCRKEAEYSAAGDMVITVEEYAKFMIATMESEYLSNPLKLERNSLQSIEVSANDVDCSQSEIARCPIQIGYGLGWNITQLADTKVIGHRGSDWSTVALAYYYSNSKDGLVIFFNAPNKAGIAAMVETLQLLDPKSPDIHGYMFRRARAN